MKRLESRYFDEKLHELNEWLYYHISYTNCFYDKDALTILTNVERDQLQQAARFARIKAEELS